MTKSYLVLLDDNELKVIRAMDALDARKYYRRAGRKVIKLKRLLKYPHDWEIWTKQEMKDFSDDVFL
jgi:hypothetical protein